MMLVRHMLKRKSQSELIGLSQLGFKHIYHTIHNQARPKEEKISDIHIWLMHKNLGPVVYH